jgi:shikimate dehydrogenase
VACVIGDPVRHSRSPAIHNAAFEAIGLDWTFVAFEVEPGHAADAVQAMRALGLAGMSVTMPHKSDVLGALDDLSPRARRLGAVNCIAWDGPQRLVGHNTDGDGFLASLVAEGIAVRGRRCVVLGAGGAARSAVLALAEAGASEVLVSARRTAAAAAAAELAGAAGATIEPAQVPAALTGADVLVNATPLGMSEGDPLPVDPAALHPGLFVAELIYHPARTALLAAAESAGAVGTNGLGMLVQQAAVAFELWTDRAAPLEVMTLAAGREAPREPKH